MITRVVLYVKIIVIIIIVNLAIQEIEGQGDKWTRSTLEAVFGMTYMFYR